MDATCCQLPVVTWLHGQPLTPCHALLCVCWVVVLRRQAIELDGTNHVFYSNRSATYLRKGDKQAALDDAIQCIKVKPDWAKG